MATKSIALTTNFQLITSAQAYIHLKEICVVEYYTIAIAQVDPLNAPPTDAAATITTAQGFGYPGGDFLYMRVADAKYAGIKIAVDEVA